jgi:prepilin-type N-terminal cleavage/methylation domain-containing protein
MRARPNRGGFTLVELLVALLISALVVIAAYAAVRIASEADARRSTAAAPVLAEQATRSALEGWLRAASVAVAPFIGEDHRAGALEVDELTLGVTDGGFLHPGPARLRLRADPRRGGVRAELVSSERGRERVTDLLLVPGARGLSLRYRTRVGGRDMWVDSWQSDVELPAAVQVRFLFGPDGQARPTSLHVLPLLLPVGWEEQ